MEAGWDRQQGVDPSGVETRRGKGMCLLRECGEGREKDRKWEEHRAVVKRDGTAFAPLP